MSNGGIPMKHVQHVLVSIVFIFLTACGGGGGTSADNPPTANAGADQTVNEMTTVSLSGTGTDTEGSVTYSWAQTSGTTVTLSDSTIANPTFTAPNVPSDEVLGFTLTVTDSAGQSVADTVTITIVNLDNTLPVVNAGPDQTVNEGDMVTLAGSGSDADLSGHLEETLPFHIRSICFHGQYDIFDRLRLSM